jgi:AcrR family transcriptional regulator
LTKYENWSREGIAAIEAATMGQDASKHARRTRRADALWQVRAGQILDAAAELVVRWGYRKTTVDDIARQAEVGKGTIYLHWRTREDLFQALLMRERVAMGQALMQRMERDPAEIQLHRLLHAILLLVESRPLVQMVFTGQSDLWGGLIRSQSGRAVQAQKMVVSAEYLDVLRRHTLLYTDLSLEKQLYAVNATVAGFFLVNPLLGDQDQLTSEERANLLAATVRGAFGPRTDPSMEMVHDAAPLVIQLFQRLYGEFEGLVYPSRRSPQTQALGEVGGAGDPSDPSNGTEA